MPKYYTKKEEFRIIGEMDILPYLKKAPDADSRFCIAIAWLTGARIQEIVNLIGKNVTIDQEEKTVTIFNKALKHGTYGYPTFSFGDPFISDIVIPWVREKAPFQKLLSRGKRRYQQILHAINVELHGKLFTKDWIVFHQMRHSRATYLARVLHAFPEEMKSWFGHKTSAYELYFAPRRVERFRGKIR